MSYYRKRRYRKRYPRRRRYYKRYRKQPYFGRFGRDVTSSIRWIKSVLNVEYKVKDIDTGAQNLVTGAGGGTFYLVNGLEKGDSRDNRDGSSIKCYSVQVRGTVDLDLTNGVTNDLVRVMIVLDKQTDSATPGLGTILSNPGDIMSFNNVTWGKRFTILSNKIIRLDDNSNKEKYFSLYKKIGVHTKYGTTNNGDITDISTNPIFVVIWGVEGTYPSAYQMNIRFRWIDN